MKIIISGSRDWFSDEHITIIYKTLSEFPVDTQIIHGGCRGVDLLAAAIAEALKFIKPREYKAKWELYNNAAGHIRNEEMIIKEHLPNDPVNIVLLFHHDIENSKGTKNMRGLCKKYNLPYKLISE